MTPPPGDDSGGGSGKDLSIARLALYSMGSAAGALLVATVLILALRPGPVVGLVIGLGGVVGAIAAMGFVSTRMTRRAYGPAVQNRAGPAVQDRDDGSSGHPAAGTGA